MKFYLYLSALAVSSYSAQAVEITVADSISQVELTQVESRSSKHTDNKHSRIVHTTSELRGNATYFEDFSGEVVPVGWVIIDNDGNTPNQIVDQFTDGWLVFEEVNGTNGNFSLQSTSWYSPAGTADDWAISPAINIGVNEELSWSARAPDPAFRDGYEVYVSTTTATINGCQANTAVFSLAAEENTYTTRAIDLSAAGYSNETIFVCFRNNSTDRNILEVDDIQVVPLVDNDLLIDGPAMLPEYTIISNLAKPDYAIPLSVEVLNNGESAQNTYLVSAEVFLDDVSVFTTSLTVSAVLESQETATVNLGMYSNLQPGTYDVSYTVVLDGVTDDRPSDNTLLVEDVLTVNPGLMARDDNVAEGSLGIGAGNSGQLGQDFVIDESVVLSSVYFRHNNNSCDKFGACTLDDQEMSVDVLEFDTVNGRPGNIIASSEIYTVEAGQATEITVQLDLIGGGLELEPGRYVIVVNEPAVANAQLLVSNERATPGTTWINWPASPLGDWGNNEDFNFFNTYMIRAVFEESTDLIFENGFD